MVSVLALLVYLGVSGAGGVVVLAGATSTTPLTPVTTGPRLAPHLPPTNTSQASRVAVGAGVTTPSPRHHLPVLVKKADLTEGVTEKSQVKDIEVQYAEEDSEYEELPQPEAQDGSNEGYVRGDGTYIVNDKGGIGCIMAYFKAKVTIYYLDSMGDYKNIQVSPPDDDGVDISGNCDRQGQESQVDVSWSSYILTLKFGLDDLTDTWFVSRFSLTYSTNDKQFEDAATGGGEVTVSSTEVRKYWQTSNAKSFRCLLLHDVALSDSLNNTATLHFDEVRVQAFCSESIFRRPKHCIHRVHRDEMVPVTVGGVLAGSTLLTIMGYGIFRYFKIKKVQYDTMQ